MTEGDDFDRLERMITHIDILCDAMVATMREMVSAMETRSQLDQLRRQHETHRD
jgi:hypothetical protein